MSEHPIEPVTQQCPNCKASLHGQFCFACGQDQKSIDRHFSSLVSEALEDIFQPNSRTFRTLLAVCFKPGFLTRDYFSGRRARYIQPVRLYFITSILFFFVISMMSGSVTSTIDTDGDVIRIEANESSKVDKIDLEFLSPEQSAALKAKLTVQIEKARQLANEDPEQIKEMVVDAAPPLIFGLLPIFAALLKLFYIGKGRFYTEHLVLALHNHSFLFIAFLLDGLLEQLPARAWSEALQIPIGIWLPCYLFLSLKVTYREGWFLTLVKFLVLGFIYGILFLITALTALLIGVMTL
jgi:hypothetical protein